MQPKLSYVKYLLFIQFYALFLFFLNHAYSLLDYKESTYPRELNSVGRNIAYYMYGPGFEPQTPHFPHLIV